MAGEVTDAVTVATPDWTSPSSPSASVRRSAYLTHDAYVAPRLVLHGADRQHAVGGQVLFDFIEWDEHNLDHATRRLTASEIEQVIWNADTMREHRLH